MGSVIRSVGRSRASLSSEVLVKIVVSELQDLFEREVDAISRDGAFPELEIVGRRTRSAGRTTAFGLTIDRPGGADLRLCERVAARLNAVLEAARQPYSLEVESAGLERPLVRPGDYTRFAGERARIVTTLSINGSKTHRGTLRGVRAGAVILETEGGALPLPIETIKSANLEYDARADLQRNKQQRKGTPGKRSHAGN
jgi:ribosome maturation factor RimP